MSDCTLKIHSVTFELTVYTEHVWSYTSKLVGRGFDITVVYDTETITLYNYIHGIKCLFGSYKMRGDGGARSNTEIRRSERLIWFDSDFCLILIINVHND